VVVVFKHPNKLFRDLINELIFNKTKTNLFRVSYLYQSPFLHKMWLTGLTTESGPFVVGTEAQVHLGDTL